MLFTIIRRNEKLAAKRSPMFDKTRFAKFLIYFMVAYCDSNRHFSRNQALSAYAGQEKKTDRHPIASVGNKPLQPLLVFPFRTFRFSFHLPLLWNDRNDVLPDRYMVTHDIEQLLVSVMQDAAQRKDRVLIASVGCI